MESLDLINWEKAKLNWMFGFYQGVRPHPKMPDNFFASTLLGVEAGDKKEPLPSLVHLSLSAVSFKSLGMEMACALNMTRLHTLKLWNCPHSIRLLDTIINSKWTMKLRTFEFVIFPALYGIQGVVSGCEMVLSAFLSTIQGLENLYLLLPRPLEWDIIMDSILDNHHSTIRRLVTHERTGNGFGESAVGKSVDGKIAWYDESEHLYQCTSLIAVGMCMSVSTLVWSRPPLASVFGDVGGLP
jgi:hypothetical protein